MATIYKVTLTRIERDQLHAIVSKGKHTSMKVKHAYILLDSDEGAFSDKMKNTEISKALNISTKTVERVKKRFVEKGFESCLIASPRTYKPPCSLDGDGEAHLVALACSKAPEGFARWSLRLLADKMVELKYIDRLSHETVRQVLKKKKLSHGNV